MRTALALYFVVCATFLFIVSFGAEWSSEKMRISRNCGTPISVVPAGHRKV
jgi:hypothetical protein